MLASIQAAKEMINSLSAQSRGSASSLSPANSGLKGNLSVPGMNALPPGLPSARHPVGAERWPPALEDNQSGSQGRPALGWLTSPPSFLSTLFGVSDIASSCNNCSIRRIKWWAFLNKEHRPLSWNVESTVARWILFLQKAKFVPDEAGQAQILLKRLTCHSPFLKKSTPSS